MTSYAKHLSVKKTPQFESIPGKQMVENSAGGFTFKINDFDRLNRFLILGADGPTYYSTEKKLTVENADCVLRCFNLDPVKTVDQIVEVSEVGRAPKNDPAIFALALCASQKGNPNSKYALEKMSKVCRIGTHLFQFVESCNELRGWGPALRKTVSAWYLNKEPKELAYQVTKYQQRNGWSHRDLLRLSHTKAKGLTNDILHWSVKGWESIGNDPHPQESLLPIWAFEKAKKTTDKKEICNLIKKYGLVRECIPTQFLTETSVWEALLEKMPLTAMIRNLATMTRIGLLSPMSNAVGKVISELSNQEKLKKSRIHPVAVLAALLTYKQGHGERSQNIWNPVSQIVDALDGAFYKTFGNVETTRKRWLLACDVSGSMDSGVIAGVPGLTPRIGTAAMAMITAATESQHHIIAFTSNGSFSRTSRWGDQYPSGITQLDISPRQRMDDVVLTMKKLPMGGTDCALPMIYAMESKIPVDIFVVYTDNETWAGKIHPCQALNEYRQKMGIGAKLAVVAMTPTEFSIADKDDNGMMDFCGFDTAVPQVMADFAKQ